MVFLPAIYHGDIRNESKFSGNGKPIVLNFLGYIDDELFVLTQKPIRENSKIKNCVTRDDIFMCNKK